jgi:hypothetical protein
MFPCVDVALPPRSIMAEHDDDFETSSSDPSEEEEEEEEEEERLPRGTLRLNARFERKEATQAAKDDAQLMGKKLKIVSGGGSNYGVACAGAFDAEGNYHKDWCAARYNFCKEAGSDLFRLSSMERSHTGCIAGGRMTVFQAANLDAVKNLVLNQGMKKMTLKNFNVLAGAKFLKWEKRRIFDQVFLIKKRVGDETYPNLLCFCLLITIANEGLVIEIGLGHPGPPARVVSITFATHLPQHTKEYLKRFVGWEFQFMMYVSAIGRVMIEFFPVFSTDFCSQRTKDGVVATLDLVGSGRALGIEREGHQLCGRAGLPRNGGRARVGAAVPVFRRAHRPHEVQESPRRRRRQGIQAQDRQVSARSRDTHRHSRARRQLGRVSPTPQ